MSDEEKLKQYMDDVMQQLFHNANDEYKDKYVTFMFSDEEINNNLTYFVDCMKKGLSAYKALTLFEL